MPDAPLSELVGDGRLAGYVTDFPSARFRGDARVVMLPISMASTESASTSEVLMSACYDAKSARMKSLIK